MDYNSYERKSETATNRTFFPNLDQKQITTEGPYDVAKYRKKI